MIDGIKYYGEVRGSIDTNYYASFYVVDAVEEDYQENNFKNRAIQILGILLDIIL